MDIAFRLVFYYFIGCLTGFVIGRKSNTVSFFILELIISCLVMYLLLISI